MVWPLGSLPLGSLLSARRIGECSARVTKGPRFAARGPFLLSGTYCCLAAASRTGASRNLGSSNTGLSFRFGLSNARASDTHSPRSRNFRCRKIWLGGCSSRNTADLRAFQAQIVHQASRIENEANDGACEAFGVDGAASAERYDCD